MSRDRQQDGYVAAEEDLRRNERQWAAYESEGHCVVLAGPGSGKTKVLTVKMARMLRTEVRPPRGIACLTFNNQCARELRGRLSRLGLESERRSFIGTVHSFCLSQIVLPYARLAGLNLGFPLAVATVGEQARLFGAAVQSVIGNENPKYVRTPFEEFRRTVLDRESSEWTENDRYAPLVEEYERLLRAAGKIDFDGMALAGLALIERHAWVRLALRARYPILVVDEYQDLGVALHRMVTKLCFEGGVRLFAVGDPDQSIYGFTGARPALMNALAQDYPVQVVRLRLNYRCGGAIISASTVALAERRDFESADDHESTVREYCCPEGFDQQVALAVENIVPEAMNARPGRRLGDIGILYLDQHAGASVARAAELAGLDYVRFDQGTPYQRTPLMSWLQECAAWCAGGWKAGVPSLSILLLQWLRFNSSVKTTSEIVDCRRQLVRFLFGLRDPALMLFDWLAAFAALGLLARIETEPMLADEAEALLSLHAASAAGNPLARYTVADFGGQEGSPDRLNLTTIHSAKGLEYDVVIMMGLEQGRIPYYRASAAEVKESRRLFYVAMTRARHEVNLLWSGWYDRGGRRHRDGRSRFVAEVMDLQA